MLYSGGDDYHPLQHTSYQDMDTQGIADLLGISQPAVSGRLKRARAKLRRALEGWDLDEEE